MHQIEGTQLSFTGMGPRFCGCQGPPPPLKTEQFRKGARGARKLNHVGTSGGLDLGLRGGGFRRALGVREATTQVH